MALKYCYGFVNSQPSVLSGSSSLRLPKPSATSTALTNWVRAPFLLNRPTSKITSKLASLSPASCASARPPKFLVQQKIRQVSLLLPRFLLPQSLPLERLAIGVDFCAIGCLPTQRTPASISPCGYC